ncbi:hypothetical protein MKW92_023589, partial [Papaver armeniacum]
YLFKDPHQMITLLVQVIIQCWPQLLGKDMKERAVLVLMILHLKAQLPGCAASFGDVATKPTSCQHQSSPQMLSEHMLLLF